MHDPILQLRMAASTPAPKPKAWEKANPAPKTKNVGGMKITVWAVEAIHVRS